MSNQQEMPSSSSTVVEDSTEKCSQITAVETAAEQSICDLSSISSTDENQPIVLKMWNFNGLKVEMLLKRKKRNSEISNETEEGDNASTVALDETETLDERLNELSELDVQSASVEATPKVDQRLELITEEVPVNDEAEEQYEGAVGLWAQDYQLLCFKTEQASGFNSSLSKKNQAMNSIQPILVNHSQPVRSAFDTLVDLNRKTLIGNKEDAECAVCKRPIENKRGIVLKDCLHVFCRRCLIHAIENNPKAVMMCPSKACIGEVRDDEIKALLDPKAYEKYVHDTLGKMDIFDITELQENYEFVENKNHFDCAICLQNIKPGDGIVIKNCLCTYCKTCLRDYIKTSDQAVVPCPFRADDGHQCVGFLIDSEIRALVSTDVYLELLTRSLNQAEAAIANTFHCKTPNCPLWVEIDEFVTDFTCPRCHRDNCIKCQTVHQGISCDQYQEMKHGPDRRNRENLLTDNQVRGLIAKKEAQPCPKCNILVERIDGCRHMICTICKHDFEWQL